MYQCGPCPVAAVRKGDIHIGFDTAFVFSEVNAEVVTWIVEDGDKLTPSGINTSQCVFLVRLVGYSARYFAS